MSHLLFATSVGTVLPHNWVTTSELTEETVSFHVRIDPLALELDIYSLAHHLCKMWLFYEPRRLKLGNTLHFVEELTKMVRGSLIK